MEISDFETKSDRLSTAHQLRQAIAFIKTSSEEAEAMDLKKRPSLKGLMASRGKGATPLEAHKVQTPINLPPPPPLPPVDQGLRPNPNPKKKRSIQELKEGEMLPQKGAKQQKARDHRDKRSKSMECQDDVEVHCSQRVWAPVIEMEEAPIPYNSTIRESSQGHSMFGSGPKATAPSSKGHGSA